MHSCTGVYIYTYTYTYYINTLLYRHTHMYVYTHVLHILQRRTVLNVAVITMGFAFPHP